MSLPNPPAYRIAWRTAKRGYIAHAQISDLHPDVIAAWIRDPTGGPFTPEQVELEISTHKSPAYVRAERPSHRRCQLCEWTVQSLDGAVEYAAELWARQQLAGVLAELAQSAPYGPPTLAD